MYRADAVGRDLDFEIRHRSGVSISNVTRYVRYVRENDMIVMSSWRRGFI